MAHAVLSTPITVPVPGTPVRVTSGFADPAAHLGVHAIMFQVNPANTDAIYIGFAGMNKTTLAGVIAVLGVPTVNFIPTFSVALSIAPNGLALEAYYIDADVAAEGCLVTYLEA